ncbi:DUF2239 family protein [Rhodobacteraceae bacterium DSL-40]|uniref:DUF2239 family protein n=1 Tax=Amaricoccus sp. B4 TaxID=3368557 RepID=UPI000DAC2D5C
MPDCHEKIFTLFRDNRRLARGPLREIARRARGAMEEGGATLQIFDDATGKPVDLDIREAQDELPATPPEPLEPAPRPRGRPRLGVVAREVTLLPRHWDWLATQPGGASQTLRRLVDAARRADNGRSQQRAAIDAASRFMWAIAGDLPNFEEATRALFANDHARLETLMSDWPGDICAHVLTLAAGEGLPPQL